jgi:hypothetical protein
MLTVADLGGALRLGYGAVLLTALSVSWAYVHKLRAVGRRKIKL